MNPILLIEWLAVVALALLVVFLAAHALLAWRKALVRSSHEARAERVSRARSSVGRVVE